MNGDQQKTRALEILREIGPEGVVSNRFDLSAATARLQTDLDLGEKAVASILSELRANGLIEIARRPGFAQIYHTRISEGGVRYLERLEIREEKLRAGALQSGDSVGATHMKYDVFIAHASEDKRDFVAPLADALKNRGLNVWYDDFALQVGDSISKKIDEGLRDSRYGVVVLSPAFFNKNWPEKEYRALVALQAVILPIWHGVGYNDVVTYSPLLADIKALSSSDDFDNVVEALIAKVRPDLTRRKTTLEAVGEQGAPTQKAGESTRETPFFTVRLGRAENDRIRGWIRNSGGGVATNVRITLAALPILEWGSIDVGDREELNFFWDLFAEGYDGVAILEFTDKYGKKWEQRSIVQSPTLANNIAHDYVLAQFGPAQEIDEYAPRRAEAFGDGNEPRFHIDLKLAREATGCLAKGTIANVGPMLSRNTRLDFPCLGKRRLGDFASGAVKQISAPLNLPAPGAQVSSGIGAVEYEGANKIYRQEARVEFPAANDIRETYNVRQFSAPRIVTTFSIPDE